MGATGAGGSMRSSRSSFGVATSTAAPVLRVIVCTVLLVTFWSVRDASSAAPGPATSKRSLAAYDAARREWVKGSTAFAFQTATYLRRCADDLAQAVEAGVKDRALVLQAIAQLRQLAGLPETSDTPAQQRAARRDLTSLNRFFGTGKLYE